MAEVQDRLERAFDNLIHVFGENVKLTVEKYRFTVSDIDIREDAEIESVVKKCIEALFGEVFPRVSFQKECVIRIERGTQVYFTILISNFPVYGGRVVVKRMHHLIMNGEILIPKGEWWHQELQPIFIGVGEAMTKAKEAEKQFQPDISDWIAHFNGTVIWAETLPRIAYNVHLSSKNGLPMEYFIDANDGSTLQREGLIRFGKDQEEILESFMGKVERVHGNIAHVTLRDSKYQELFADYDAEALAALGIEEGDRFCCLVKKHKSGSTMTFVPVPKRELTEEEWQKIRRETEEALRGDNPTDDY